MSPRMTIGTGTICLTKALSGMPNDVSGCQRLNIVVINAVIPVLYCYGLRHDKQEIKDRCFSFLEEMEGEDNKIVRAFRKNGVIVGCARHSQALIHLYREYCMRRRCLECRVFGALKLL